MDLGDELGEGSGIGQIMMFLRLAGVPIPAGDERPLVVPGQFQRPVRSSSAAGAMGLVWKRLSSVR